MPRNMSGREMSRIDWLMVTITTPRVAKHRAVDLWDTGTKRTLAAYDRTQHVFFNVPLSSEGSPWAAVYAPGVAGFEHHDLGEPVERAN